MNRYSRYRRTWEDGFPSPHGEFIFQIKDFDYISSGKFNSFRPLTGNLYSKSGREDWYPFSFYVSVPSRGIYIPNKDFDSMMNEFGVSVPSRGIYIPNTLVCAILDNVVFPSPHGEFIFQMYAKGVYNLTECFRPLTGNLYSKCPSLILTLRRLKLFPSPHGEFIFQIKT